MISSFRWNVWRLAVSEKESGGDYAESQTDCRCFASCARSHQLTAAQDTPTSGNQIDGYLQNALDKYAEKDSPAWGARMYRLLEANRDADATARVLAKDDRLPVEIEKKLISLWMANTELSNSRERSQNPDAFAAKISRLNQQSVETVRASGHARLVIQLAADILNAYHRCEVDPFQSLIANAPDALAVGSTAAQETGCTSGLHCMLAFRASPRFARR
jgi:hypothetical protein